MRALLDCCLALSLGARLMHRVSVVLDKCLDIHVQIMHCLGVVTMLSVRARMTVQ